MSEFTTAPVKQGSVWEDILEVLWAPATVFERSRGRGPGMYLLILTIIAIVLVVATKGLLQPYVDANSEWQLIQQAKTSGQTMTPEQLGGARTVIGYTMLGGLALTPLFSGFFGAIFVWLAAKVLKAPLGFGAAVLVSSLASVPRLISIIATAVQGAALDTSGVRSLFDASLGPARFVDPNAINPAVMAMLGSFDLFSIWVLAITAIGISVVARVSRSTGWVTAIVSFGMGLALTLIPAAMA